MEQPVFAKLPQDTFDQRIDWATVLVTPLAPGAQFQFYVYDPSTGSSSVRAKVEGLERIQVPAGSYDAYKVRYTIGKSSGSEEYVVYASQKTPRILIKEEFSNGFADELLEVREPSDR